MTGWFGTPAGRTGRVFVSYRRADSGGHAGRFNDGMRARLGPDSVFFDLEGIPGGTHFVERIDRELLACDALIAIIGPQWVAIQDAAGQRRLDKPDDYVRHELVTAIRRGLPILPVLVGNAPMPDRAELPDEMQALAYFNAVDVSDVRWEYDLDRVVQALGLLAPALARPERRATLSTIVAGRLARIVSLATLVLTLAVTSAFWFGYVPFGRVPPTRMVGDLNVAVAEFTTGDPGGDARASPEGRELGRSVHESLVSQLQSMRRADDGGPYHIQVLPPAETGPILGATPQDRATRAADLALEVQADLVVYGTARLDDTAASFFPELYVSDRQLSGAEELAGQYELGSRLSAQGSFGANPAARRSLRDQIPPRVLALVQFTYGLGYYAQGDLERALGHFQESASSPSWADCGCGYMLDIFMANTHGRARRWSESATWYQRALTAEPESARAQLGIAELQFQRSTGSCTPTSIDRAGLEAAIAGFQRALDAKVQPALSDIKPRVAFKTARGYFCLTQALQGDYSSESQALLVSIVQEFEAGNSRIRHLAAEAHGILALLALPPEDDPDPASYRMAAKGYREAIRLSRDPVRQASFYGSLGWVYGRLKEPDEVNRAFDEAIRLDPANRQRYEDRRLSALA